MKLRAVIHDQKLFEQTEKNEFHLTSLYGYPQKEANEINIAKKVGYGISIFFLLLTVIIHFFIEDIRQVSF